MAALLAAASVACAASHEGLGPRLQLGRRQLFNAALGAAVTRHMPAIGAPDPALAELGFDQVALDRSNVAAIQKALADGLAPATCGRDLASSDLVEEAEVNVFSNACMRLPARVIPCAGRVLVLEQSQVQSGQTGAAVWNGALALARAMEGIGPSAFAGKRVLELGAGCGLGSAVAHTLGASLVVATDSNDSLLAQCRRNLDANRMPGGGEVAVQPLAWSGPNAERFLADVGGGKPFDWVIGSDVTYNSGAWRPLAQTILQVGDPSTRTLLACTDRYPGEFISVRTFFEGSAFRCSEVSALTVGESLVHVFALSRAK